MPRRKADSDDEIMEIGTTTGTKEPPVKEPGVREQVIVSQKREVVGGSPRDALEKLNDADKKAAADGNGEAEESVVRFSDAITKAGNHIVVYRYAPKVDPATNADITGQVDVLPPPFRSTDLEDHVKKTHGGGKYHVSVFGPEDDQVEIAGKNFDISGDPILIGPARPQFQFDERPMPRSLFEEEEHRDPTHRIMQDQLKNMEHQLRMKTLQKNIKRISEDDDEGARRDIEIEARSREAETRTREAAASAREAESLRLEIVRKEADADRKLAEQERKALEERQRREVEDVKNAFNAKLDRLMEQMERTKEEGGGATKMIELQAKLESARTEQKFELEKLAMTLREAAKPVVDNRPDPMVQILPLFMKSMEAVAAGNQQTAQMMMTMMQQNAQQQATQQQSALTQAANQQTLLMTLMTKNTENMMGLISDDKDRKNPISGLREAMGLMREVGDTMGVGGPVEPKSFGDRVLDAVEKVVPEVLEFVRERQERGLEATKKEIQNQARTLATSIANELAPQVAQARGGALPLGSRARIPVLQQTLQQAPQQAPQPIPVQAPVDDRPPADYVGSAPVPPAPVPQVVSQVAAQPEIVYAPPPAKPLPDNFVDVETRRRVDHVLKLLFAEIQVLPGMQMWVDEALKHLPKKVLTAVVAADNDEQLHEAVKPWGSQELMDGIWGVIKDSEDAREWLTDGINDLKDAYAGKDEEGEEEGPEEKEGDGE